MSDLLSKLVDAGLIGGESSDSTPAAAPGPGPEGGVSGGRVTPPPMLRQTPPPPITGPRLSLTPATLKQLVCVYVQCTMYMYVKPELYSPNCTIIYTYTSSVVIHIHV